MVENCKYKEKNLFSLQCNYRMPFKCISYKIRNFSENHLFHPFIRYSFQSQILTLTGEKQDLEMQVSSITAQLKTDKHRLTVAERKVSKLESELEEKECQCTAYYNALEVRGFT